MRRDTVLLEQVSLTLGTRQDTGGLLTRPELLLGLVSHVELELDILSESTGVIIPYRLGVTKGLQQRVGLENTLDDWGHFIAVGLWALLARSDVIHTDLHGLSFTCSRFTRNKDRLVRTLECQTIVGHGRSFVDMRLDLVTVVAFNVLPNEHTGVSGTNFLRVDLLEPLEGVHCDHYITCSGVRLACSVTFLQIVEDSGLCVVVGFCKQTNEKNR